MKHVAKQVTADAIVGRTPAITPVPQRWVQCKSKKQDMKFSVFLFFTILSFFPINGQNLDLKFEDYIDLNSDGKVDHVLIEKIDDTYAYRLTINDVSITDRIDPFDGFLVVDITTWDSYKEIAVHTPGPSNDDVYMIYWYDGKSIKFIDRLERWPTFTGNGILYVNNWEGFWSPRDKYELDNSTRKLILVEQFAYYVGVKTKVEKGFKIYQNKDLASEVALLAEQSEIEILLCDKKGKGYFDYLYLIKSSSGLIGWADFKSFSEKVKLQMAD